MRRPFLKTKVVINSWDEIKLIHAENNMHPGIFHKFSVLKWEWSWCHQRNLHYSANELDQTLIQQVRGVLEQDNFSNGWWPFFKLAAENQKPLLRMSTYKYPHKYISLQILQKVKFSSVFQLSKFNFKFMYLTPLHWHAIFRTCESSQVLSHHNFYLSLG